jgi:hypothetical protein
MIKSRRLRWEGHVGRMRCDKFWTENLKERDYSQDPGAYGRIILNWSLVRECDWREDNNKPEPREVSSVGMCDWIHLKVWT